MCEICSVSVVADTDAGGVVNFAGGVVCPKQPESSTLDIAAWFMLMGRFAGRIVPPIGVTGTSACSMAIASAAVLVPGSALPRMRPRHDMLRP